MSARSHDLSQAHCASRAQKRTRLYKMLDLLLVIMWNAPSSLLLRMDLLRRLCGVDLVHPRSGAACAHSGTMGSVDLVGEGRAVVTVVALLLFLPEIGSEARGFRKEVDGVAVAGGGHHISKDTGGEYW